MFAHPTWTDKHGIKHLTVPKELSDLREGEKLLIQQVSPYIPLQHLQKGTYGCKGHVCSFPQTIHNICTVLPRLPSDITIVNIVKRLPRQRSKSPFPHISDKKTESP